MSLETTTISQLPTKAIDGGDYLIVEDNISTGKVTVSDLMSSYGKIQYDTTAAWNSRLLLIAERGTIYVYSDYATIIDNGETKNVPGIKIGDGSSYLIDMPFMASGSTGSLTVFIDPTNYENVIFANL